MTASSEPGSSPRPPASPSQPRPRRRCRHRPQRRRHPVDGRLAHLHGRRQGQHRELGGAPRRSPRRRAVGDHHRGEDRRLHEGAYNFLWNIGADGDTTNYFFASVRDTPEPRSPRRPTVARRTPAPRQLRGGSLTSVTSVIDGAAGTISLYVDGVLASTTPSTLTPASITNQSLNTIGRAPWPDPLFKGEVSTFRDLGQGTHRHRGRLGLGRGCGHPRRRVRIRGRGHPGRRRTTHARRRHPGAADLFRRRHLGVVTRRCRSATAPSSPTCPKPAPPPPS